GEDVRMTSSRSTRRPLVALGLAIGCSVITVASLAPERAQTLRPSRGPSLPSPVPCSLSEPAAPPGLSGAGLDDADISPRSLEYEIVGNSFAWIWVGCWVNLPDEDGIRGRFRLVPVPKAGRILYAVEDMELTFLRHRWQFSGQGWFWPVEPGGRQRMTLTLDAQGIEPIHFESDSVRLRRRLPRIGIVLYQVDQLCTDITLDLRAVPVSEESTLRPRP